MESLGKQTQEVQWSLGQVEPCIAVDSSGSGISWLQFADLFTATLWRCPLLAKSLDILNSNSWEKEFNWILPTLVTRSHHVPISRLLITGNPVIGYPFAKTNLNAAFFILQHDVLNRAGWAEEEGSQQAHWLTHLGPSRPVLTRTHSVPTLVEMSLPDTI